MHSERYSAAMDALRREDSSESDHVSICVSEPQDEDSNDSSDSGFDSDAEVGTDDSTYSMLDSEDEEPMDVSNNECSD